MEFVRAAASLTTNEGAEERKRTSSRVAPLFPLRARHGHLRGFTLRGCQTFGSQSRETAEVGGAKVPLCTIPIQSGIIPSLLSCPCKSGVFAPDRRPAILGSPEFGMHTAVHTANLERIMLTA